MSSRIDENRGLAALILNGAAKCSTDARSCSLTADSVAEVFDSTATIEASYAPAAFSSSSSADSGIRNDQPGATCLKRAVRSAVSAGGPIPTIRVTAEPAGLRPDRIKLSSDPATDTEA